MRFAFRIDAQNAQNIEEGSSNTDQPGNVLFLLKHIAHIKASVTSSLAYAMVIDPKGRIIARNMLGNTYFEGQKLDDESEPEGFVWIGILRAE